MRTLIRRLTSPPKRARRTVVGPRRVAVATLAATALLVSGLALPGAATKTAPDGAPTVAPMAAGQLATSIEWVDYATGAPISDLQAGLDSRTDASLALVTLRVGYTCGPAACDNTTVNIAPMPLDPYYGTQRFATFSQRSLPPDATFSGNATAGYTVGLGNLAPGTSGSFTLTYNHESRPVGASPQSFFPEGYSVPATATISADGIEAFAATDDVTWHIDTPDPRVSVKDDGVARADQDYTYTLYMSASCQYERSTAGHGEPVYECAASHTTTQHLPAEAIFVSTTHGGVYDAGTRSVTWTTSGQQAAIGWGPMGGLGQPRNVVVRFPASIVADPDNCIIDVSTDLTVDMTYLSGTQKSATTTATRTVNACEPFANASLTKTTTRNAGTAGAPVVWSTRAQSWSVRVANRSNVPGVTTITDTFDQAGLDVYSILGPVARVTATLDDGQVETVDGPYTVPAGRSIVAATVETVPLAGPNISDTDTSKVNYQDVVFKYTVEADVPAEGYMRTNTATAVMEFPGTPELAPLDLGPSSQEVQVLRVPARLTPLITSTVSGSDSIQIGDVVTFTVSGATFDVQPGVPFKPQYAFVAPAGWEIEPGSAAVAGLDDVEFSYRTVDIDGESRQMVLAQRPQGTVWGINERWPNLTVRAAPTPAVAAGSLSVAHFYQGDAAHNYVPTTAIWGNNGNYRYQDAADLDGDKDTTEYFAYAVANVRIGATASVSVLKEICQPDASQLGGCLWLSNPDEPVEVAPDTTGITYRVTVTNTGSTALKRRRRLRRAALPG